MDGLALGHAGTGGIRLSLLIHQLCGELGSVCESDLVWRQACRAVLGMGVTPKECTVPEPQIVCDAVTNAIDWVAHTQKCVFS